MFVNVWQFAQMATINGARAMGWELRIGSLEVGKQADVVSILLRNTPVFDVFSSLVYVMGERVFACVSFWCALLLLHVVSSHNFYASVMLARI